MQLTDIVTVDCVKVPLEARDKQDAIFQLADVVAGAAGLEDPEELKEAVWHREQTRTTGIGHGIAIPHGKCSGCQRLAMAIGRAAEPLEFGAIDKKPVSLIFLLASPLDQTGPHIQALASVSKVLVDPAVRDAFLTVHTPEQVMALLAEHEPAS